MAHRRNSFKSRGDPEPQHRPITSAHVEITMKFAASVSYFLNTLFSHSSIARSYNFSLFSLTRSLSCSSLSAWLPELTLCIPTRSRFTPDRILRASNVAPLVSSITRVFFFQLQLIFLKTIHRNK